MPDFSFGSLDCCGGCSAYFKNDKGELIPMKIGTLRVDHEYGCVDPAITLSGYLMKRDSGFSVTVRRDDQMAYKKVIYNDPATIVLWADGSKTVVKCDPKDKYDKTKGLALCFMKKALGNTSRTLNDILHKEEGSAP